MMPPSSSQSPPSFDDLPLRPGDPPHSAWGLWKSPALGALNYLTDDVVLKATQEEIRTGERITLKYVSWDYHKKCDGVDSYC